MSYKVGFCRLVTWTPIVPGSQPFVAGRPDSVRTNIRRKYCNHGIANIQRYQIHDNIIVVVNSSQDAAKLFQNEGHDVYNTFSQSRAPAGCK